MTERYENLSRTELHARLRAERDALLRGPEADRLEHELSVQQLELEIQNRELHAASARVQDARDSLAEASEEALEAQLELDSAGRVGAFDEAAERLLGSSDSFQARPLISLVHPVDQAKLERYLAVLQAGQDPGDVELRMMPTDRRPLRVRMRVDGRTQGEALARVVYLLDITRQRQAEADARRHINAIARAARLNALGEMASGIAHELSQPLSAIVAYARAGRHLMQVDGPQARTELEQSLEKVAQQAERAADIIRRIRGFVHKETPRFDTHRVSDLLYHALAVLEDDFQERDVTVQLVQVPRELTVWADAIFVEQVMVNLLRNAIDSIVAAGAERREIEVRISSLSRGQVEISFSDTGEGLAGQNPEQWFMPFSTTRRGSLGLSLSLSRSLVEAHGGHLWAESSASGGALLRFTLPSEPSQ